MKNVILIFTFITLFLTPVNAQWEYLNEGLGGSINCIEFINENIGWIAGGGGGGILYKTYDGGENWIKIVLNVAYNLIMVDFISESTGWAVTGDYPVRGILKTIDGGYSWILQEEFTTSLSCLLAIDENHVFVSGRDYILKTSDGGENWLTSNYNELNFYSSICFLNPDSGVVSGRNADDGNKGVFVRTTDGGNHWEQTIVPGFSIIYNLQLINDESIYFSTNSSYLYKSADLLQSWSTIQTPYTLNSFQFLDSSTVYAIMSDSNEIHIMISENGGFTWEILKSFESFPCIEWHFNELNKGFFSESTYMPFPVSMAALYLFFKYEVLENVWSLEKFGYIINDIRFRNNNSGFLFGGAYGSSVIHSCWTNGRIFSTTDGGNSWTVSDDFNNILVKCQFVTEDIGIVLAKSCDGMITYKTNNGGADWQMNYVHDPNSTGYNFIGNDLVFNNEESGWTVGKFDEGGDTTGAGILVTSDGGENWALCNKFQDSSEYEYNLQSICVVDSNCWSVGESGMILKYTPQYEWSSIASVTTLPLNKVHFFDENCGWITGGYLNNNGFQHILLRTTDGGENWETDQSLPYLINDIYFIDSLLGWAVGTDENWKGVILKTTNGGVDWEVVVDNLQAKLISITIKENYAWAAGENGLVLRTTDNGVNWIDERNNKIYPTEFILEQNYPNPFNPTTTIKYQIPNRSFVTLKIYDVLGNEIETIVNEEQTQGVYEIEYDGSKLSSGVYLYKLETDTYSETRKMVIIK